MHSVAAIDPDRGATDPADRTRRRLPLVRCDLAGEASSREREPPRAQVAGSDSERGRIDRYPCRARSEGSRRVVRFTPIRNANSPTKR